MSRAAPAPFSVLQAAREQPRRDALVVDGVVRSYSDLAQGVRGAIERLAEQPSLAPRAGRSAPRVALVAHASEAALVHLLALVELRHPVVLLHPRNTPREHADLLDHAPTALHIDGERLRLLAPPPTTSSGFDEEHRAALAAGGDANPANPANPDEACLAVVATSGSTGRPRAVALSHRALAAACAASAAHLGLFEDDRWLLAIPFAHVGGLSVILRSLWSRGAVVLSTPAAGPSPASSPEAMAEVVERDRVTLISMVPTQLHRLLEGLPDWRPPGHLRAILVGGAAASPRLLGRARGRGLPVLATYGLTESAGQVATQGLDVTAEDDLGAPLSAVELRITGEGAIALRGPSLCSGYLEAGQLRSALDAEGWLVTRDAGELDARGHLRVLGRLDEVIVTAGEKLHPAEVERLLEEIPGIAAACVFSVADEERGAVVGAALVALPGAGLPTHAELGEAARAAIDSALQDLAPWKRPRHLIWLDALPLGPTGKVDRRAVAQAALLLTRSG